MSSNDSAEKGRAIQEDTRREDELAEHVENPDAFDKLGDPNMGRNDPGRCAVCLAWVRYPYGERTVAVCPDCHEKTEAEREAVRSRVRDALQPVWKGIA